MNNEFDTVVEDGSLSEVAQQICTLFNQCCEGQVAEVREKVAKLSQKRYDVKTSVIQAKAEDESSEEEEEAMECTAASGDASSQAGTSHQTPGSNSQPHRDRDEDDEGWTVVQRKKK
nr:PREDICTED: pre-rRNA-processing protein TSR2 homolog [Latimeria chalumnae]|eukprot:XP_006014535.2 PREDICTED: pre-rRNA-processing protein TSR2 homolog [Latimeria chalumnae]